MNTFPKNRLSQINILKKYQEKDVFNLPKTLVIKGLRRYKYCTEGTGT